MARSIVILCDGTWNTPATKTAIEWLAENCESDAAQLVHYDPGVGTGDWFDHVLGGAIGTGLSRNVQQAYARLLEVGYQPGDRVFLFGFSRGAFTARSLAGFVAAVGILNDPDLIRLAWLYYRLHSGPHDPLAVRLLGDWLAGRKRCDGAVWCVGVFDTVGALGIPFSVPQTVADSGLADELARFGLDHIIAVAGELQALLRRPIVGFHDTTLGPHVAHARQALAIDERREAFLPTFWSAAPAQPWMYAEDGSRVPVPDPSVRQLWFAGAHSDVGGGYGNQDTELSFVPRRWLVGEAVRL